MILVRGAVAAAAGRVLMTVPVVVVPERAVIAGIAFEKEAGRTDRARGFGAADRAGCWVGGCRHRAFEIEGCVAIGTTKTVDWHLR